MVAIEITGPTNPFHDRMPYCLFSIHHSCVSNNLIGKGKQSIELYLYPNVISGWKNVAVAFRIRYSEVNNFTISHMQEQNQQSTPVPPKNSPPEQKQMSRTHLYILLAILSVAVIGLAGYIIWDLYRTEEGDATPEQATTNETVNTEGTTAEGEEPTTNEQAETEEPESATDPYEGWLTYDKTEETGYSFKYPSTATLNDCTEYDATSPGPGIGCPGPSVYLSQAINPFGLFQIEVHPGAYSNIDEYYNNLLTSSPWGGSPTEGTLQIGTYTAKTITGNIDYESESQLCYTKHILVHTGDSLFIISARDFEDQRNRATLEYMIQSVDIE
jgi:nitrate reductase NapE component